MDALVFDFVRAVVLVQPKKEGHPVNLKPPLEDVRSDKKFYGPPFPADYPHDSKPQQVAGMEASKGGATYPSLQDAHVLDKDYVKDDNKDNGEWLAQMEYDRARSRTAKEEQELKHAKEVADHEGKEAEKAEKHLKDADAHKAAAEADASRAEEAAKVASEAEKETERRSVAGKKTKEELMPHSANTTRATNVTKEEIARQLAEAEEKLRASESAFKECERQLAEAQAEVERLQAQMQQEQPQPPSQALATEPGTSVSPEELEAARSQATAALAKRDAAKAVVVAAAARQQEMQAHYAQEKRQSDEAAAIVEKDKARLVEAQLEFADAQVHLRKARGLKSSGPRACTNALLVVFAVAGRPFAV